MTNPSNLPLVLVTWKDANVGGDDVVTLDNVSAYHKPTIVHTLGWLLKEDEEGITICNEFYDEFYRGRTFIYRPMIMSVDPYTLAKPRKVKRASKPTSPTATATESTH